LRAGFDGIAGEALLGTIIIINHFERTKVEFANVSCAERIFPPALAALETLHKAFVFVHKNSILALFRAIKNPFSYDEKG
jgi:hypothetical protein